MRFPLFASIVLTGVFASTADAQVSTSRAAHPLPGKTTPVRVTQKPQAVKNPAGYQAVLPPSAPLPPNQDDCNLGPDVVVGNGPHNFDNSIATQGVEGQTEALCNQLGSTNVFYDVWFSWTPTTSGVCTLTACGLTTVDTKIAVYAGGTNCPSGAALACNDDNCGGLYQSTLTFPVTMGNPYLIQLGCYPGQFPPATPGTGQFSFTVTPAATNDDCLNATAIMGLGTFNYDTSGASTGTQGQNEAACLAFGTTAIDGDVWFNWTSTVTGTVSVNTCAGFIDSKIGVYPGPGCPTAGTALACDDDGCGIIGAGSRAIANVTAGQVYTIQIGQYPGAAGGIATFDIQQVILPAEDNCGTPIAISGPGFFAFDNTFATTGTQGQAESLCSAFGSTVVANDVWYNWTATSTGQHTLSFCGNSVDTKVGVYVGTGCPTSAAIACNDDKCGFQSEVCFPATSGTTYIIQIGTYPFGPAPGGSGAFSLQPTVLGAGNDECSLAVALGGLGPHNYDNSAATTGCDGQSNGACNFFGTSNIDNDIWFTWVAPSTSGYDLSFCGLAVGMDTKVAVYDGGGCPTAQAIACNDDGAACGSLESDVCFSAIGGQTYTFQVGNYPGAAGGMGAFVLTPVALPTGCQYDNATSENSVGYPGLATAAIMWIQRFGAIGQNTTITQVQAAFGTPLFPGGTAGLGAPVIAAVWDDPNDDGNPADCVLLASAGGNIMNVDNDVLDSFPLGGLVNCPGVYFVGVMVANTATGQFPATLDQDSCPAGSAGRSWIFGNQSGTINLTSIPANDLALSELDAIGIPGVWLIRTDCAVAPTGTSYCFGDGSGTLCPCQLAAPPGGTGPIPPGLPGHGCPNSVNPNGALLEAFTGDGTAHLTLGQDSLVLKGSGMSATGTCLYFQGNNIPVNPNQLILGDGLRCATGGVIRLGQKPNVGGASQYPNPAMGELPVSVRAAQTLAIPAGATRRYQAWYRNSALFCVSTATFNLTNGIAIVWQL